MTDSLQAFDYRRSPYERPNQKWVCGRLAEGAPCHIGPDGRGHCRADFACRPAKVDDRWRCARSELAGGKCEQGPLPDGTCCVAIPSCRPRLSWRGRRGMIARWVAAVTVGAVLTMMSGVAGPSFLSPGELTIHHAAIKDCGECHSAFDRPATGWVGLAFQEWPVREDSKRCLGCHRRGGRGQRPHDLSPRELDALTAEAAPASARAEPLALTLAAMAFDRGAGEHGDQPCGTCHREHRGSEHDLRAMGNVRCMSCHATKFASLAEGHPEFSGYPFDRRTRLFFDHTSHFGKHFRDRAVKQRAPFSCKACHAPEADGRAMLTRPFAASCGDCHAEQIAGAGRAGSKGIAVLALPGLDLVGLHEGGAAIGGWPEDADDTLTPFMKLLLAADDDGGDAIAAIEDLDLLDLEQASEAEIDAVEALAWRIKSLLFELTTEGAPALEARLERVFGRPLDPSLPSRLVGQLPVDSTRAAALAWFPDLHGEIPRHRAGETVPIPQDGDTAEVVPDQAPAAAPGDDDEDASILDEDEDEDASILDEDEDDDILDEDEDTAILDEERRRLDLGRGRGHWG